MNDHIWYMALLLGIVKANRWEMAPLLELIHPLKLNVGIHMLRLNLSIANCFDIRGLVRMSTSWSFLEMDRTSNSLVETRS
jgi:hypothetical protein